MAWAVPEHGHVFSGKYKVKVLTQAAAGESSLPHSGGWWFLWLHVLNKGLRF